MVLKSAPGSRGAFRFYSISTCAIFGVRIPSIDPMQKKAASKRPGAVRDIIIKRAKDDDNFAVHHIEPSNVPMVESLENDDLSTGAQELEDAMEQVFPNDASQTDRYQPERAQIEDSEPKDFVKVKFSKFVQLVSTHDFTEVIDNNENEDVILSSNLLADLAGSHDQKEERKIPLVFLVGLAIGVILTYILLTK